MTNLRYQWSPYLMYGQKMEVKKNVVVYRQGEQGKGFYYLDRGGLKIILLSANGHERTIDYVPVGMLSGEHGAYKGSYLTSAITTNPSILYYFSDEALNNICMDHPQAAVLFTNSQIFKVRLLAEVIAFQDSPVEQQMAHYLIRLHSIHQNENVPIDQTSFARYIDASRITVNKILHKWKEMGIIELSHRGAIRIVEIDKMNEIATREEESVGISLWK
ncbi:Crp/Fnr family transcriptional regulator [Brevibacillus panacihumi W25]|uniref:Crp/Fnr family transcriptional regulator n=2 Tax=Brevibacillus panacihumi TaxID=497735 RepID=V6M6I7_9BACL|nr:Crp/Fnr family transcriptional regulator [Brevibacillus panacihumi]EST54154.1 Crp/Fnr family transcriptional regulator [Brevibacillus panacihumi W25]RNB78228.1 Crp/Fnr family transcriptional regulator [Brevibacillus panacihumi]